MGAQGDLFLPLLQLVWSLVSHPSEASTLCLRTGQVVPLWPHSEGTDCPRLGPCSRLLLGTGIAPPQDIWGLRGTAATCTVITRASIKSNQIFDQGMLLPAMVPMQTVPGSQERCWTTARCWQCRAGGSDTSLAQGLLVQLLFCYGAISSILRVSDTHAAQADSWVHGQGRVQAEPGMRAGWVHASTSTAAKLSPCEIGIDIKTHRKPWTIHTKLGFLVFPMKTSMWQEAGGVGTGLNKTEGKC